LSGPVEDIKWLYRGVPRESPEVADVEADGEVRPPRLDRVGEFWRHAHVCGDTETGYTSWTTDRSIAEEAADAASEGLSGQIVIFRVRVRSLPEDRLFEGREDEWEWLIEGTVEEVSISESPADEEDDD
jgi:hypothetical protein